MMVLFGTDSVAEAFRLGALASIECNKLFEEPNDLEMEKVYKPYLLFNKKRYAGLMWVEPSKWKKIDIKGLEIIRRDNCRLVRDTMRRCLELLLQDSDVPGAVAFVKKTVSDLLQNRFDMSRFVISKSLGKAEYKSKLPHTELAKRMWLRDSGSAPSVGERVAYVVLAGTKKAKVNTLAEDPLYALKHNLPLNFRYYIEQQLRKPIERLFEPIIADPSVMFTGDHTRHVVKPTSKSGPMARFVVVSKRCLGCKSVLPPPAATQGAVCARCTGDEVEIHGKYKAALDTATTERTERWDQCIDCQDGSLEKANVCSNQDCSNLYQRFQANTIVDDLSLEFQRFTF